MANTETIYLDEAGNTGQDLLNKDQQVFVLASNNYSNDQLKVLAALFPNPQELHFVKLKGSQIGRASLIEFINHPLITEQHIECFTAHKEYATVGHIVDRLIEPVLYDRGIDIYEYGRNIIALNYIYHFGVGNIWDKTLFEKFVAAFMRMMREQTTESIDEFYDLSEVLYASPKTKEKILLQPVLESKNQIKDILEHVDKFALDVTLSAFMVICDRWHKKTGKKLQVLQDDSKQIEHFRDHINFTINLEMPKEAIGFDSRTLTYPTQVESLQMVSSQNHLGVQISDLLASSIAFMYSNKNAKHAPFVKEIQESKLLNLTNYFTVWPNSYITPESLGMAEGKGTNPIDFLAHKLYDKEKRTNKKL